VKDTLKLLAIGILFFGSFYLIELAAGDNAAKTFQRSIDGYLKNQKERLCD